jgi:uncharacterized protein
MDEHPNAKLLREADSTDSFEDFAKLLADDVEWHELGKDEPIHGKAALMGGGPRDYDFVEMKTHDIVANDDHAVALVTTTAKRGDKTLTYRTAEIYHMKDGKITERWAFSDDTDAINRFFG